MNYRFVSVALACAALLLSAGQSSAADQKAEAPQQAASKAVGKAATQATSKTGAAQKSGAAVRAKTSAAVKLVDINSAKPDQLKTLPGISDAEAAKIVAGRPYGSKAQLVSRNVLAGDVYQNLKRLIVAKQPYKDVASNAAIYAKKK